MQVQSLTLAGTKPRVNRYNTPAAISFAYTQTTVRLYPNDCAPIRKQLFDYTRFQSHSSTIVIYLHFGIDVFLATWRHQQFRIVALGPLLQLLAGRIECKTCDSGKHASSDKSKQSRIICSSLSLSARISWVSGL